MRKFLVVCMVLIGCAAYAQKPYSAQYFQETNPSNLPAINNGLFDSTGWDNPKKATVLALVLPGAGQIYNKKYWKVGIVYAGIGGLVYMFKWNSDSLRHYQAIYTSKIDGDSTTLDPAPLRSDASIKNDRDFHRRYRDVSIIGFVALYALQAIDANVDAHLKEFRVNKDLSMKVSPDIYAYKPSIGRYSGLTVSLRF
ncbi:MAG: DUF5683 domain-containing protein [Bacteroidia bacterium]